MGDLTRGRAARAALAALAVGAALFAAYRFLPLRDALARALDWVAALGPAGVAAYVALYVAACVLMLPGAVLTLGAGAVYGVVAGTAIVSAASTLGATAAFLVGRHLARARVARLIGADPRFRAIDEAVGREGWKIVGLTRLSPAFPFNLLNYAYGVSGVSLRDFVLASWVGMFPGTVLYVYLGSLAGDVATLDARGGGRSPAEWALTAVGLVATVVVTAYVTRLARAALGTKIGRGA